jgi:N-methylhydantoinase A
VLVAYGGAGPLHAARLAQSLGIPRVIVPAYASTFSALGCLAAELRYDLVRTYRRPLAGIDPADLAARLAEIEAAAAEPLRSDGHSAGAIATRRALDLRYTGQNYELEVLLAPGPAAPDPATIRQRFLDQHRRLYSYATDEPVECTALRVVAFVPGPVPDLPERQPSGPSLVESAYACQMPGHGRVSAAIFRRMGLPIDEPIDGPALIEDDQSTTVVPPGTRVRADAVGNLLLEAP